MGRAIINPARIPALGTTHVKFGLSPNIVEGSVDVDVLAVADSGVGNLMAGFLYELRKHGSVEVHRAMQGKLRDYTDVTIWYAGIASNSASLSITGLASELEKRTDGTFILKQDGALFSRLRRNAFYGNDMRARVVKGLVQEYDIVGWESLNLAFDEFAKHEDYRTRESE